MFSPLVDELITALRILPGVGPKSAQRMALHLLERERLGAEKLSKSLEACIERVGRCQRCRTLTEEPLCGTCSNTRRDSSLLCIVETPADILAVEQAGYYHHYFYYYYYYNRNNEYYYCSS